MILTKNTDYFTTEHYATGLSNGDNLCRLYVCGRPKTFLYNIFKMRISLKTRWPFTAGSRVR